MAKLRMFAIFDSKAAAYLPPFFLPEIGQAHRLFGDCCRNPEHEFGKHPEDYTLFILGFFDVPSGQFEKMKNGNEVICNGLECLIQNVRGAQLALVEGEQK